VLRTEASAVLQTPQIRCDIPDPGIDRQFDKYNYSKQTSTVLGYDLSEYDVFGPYNTHGCKCTHQKDQGKQPYQDSDGNKDGTARHFSQPT